MAEIHACFVQDGSNIVEAADRLIDDAFRYRVVGHECRVGRNNRAFRAPGGTTMPWL